MAMEISVNRTSTDTCLWHIERELMQRYGVDRAKRYMEPLHYYISTGRASVEFIRKLMQAKPFMVARKLAKGGSTDEALKRVQSYIGYTPYTI